MKSCAVIYQSKYGTTKKYAAWIAEELGADLFDKAAVKSAEIEAYDTVIYGGALYAGGISGVKLVAKRKLKRLIVFTVGLAEPATTDYSAILKKNFSPGLLNDLKVFHLRGGIDYAKLGIVHKAMMAMMRKSTLDKPVAERTEEDQAMLATYGGRIDFTDKAAITPLIEYARAV